MPKEFPMKTIRIGAVFELALRALLVAVAAIDSSAGSARVANDDLRKTLLFMAGGVRCEYWLPIKGFSLARTQFRQKRGHFF
jgi:hypothetical protein